MMITTILYTVATLLGLGNLAVELRRDLMMFQQNSYRAERYRRWLAASGDTTSGWRLCGILIFFLALMPLVPATPAVILLAIFFLLNSLTLVKRKYKKPLVMTNRARRIYVTAFFVGAIVCAVGMLLFGRFGIDSMLFALVESLLFCYCVSHVIILAAGALLSPVEKSINNGYIRDARNILAQMPGLRIIGITGSYGKTSTKHYLYRILSEQYETLMTPGSYNTTLGVVRTIRELLKPYHEVFIVEMGAKQPDDIAEICRIVHPRRGIITAVGPQHLESFKTIEAVQATKFELADALPSDGLVVVNNDFEMIASRPVSNVPCLRYAVKNTEGADYIARDISYSAAGTDFTVIRVSDGKELRLHTRLVGECNVSNLLAAVAMAVAMGVPDDRIVYAVSQIEHVEHRLAVKHISSDLTIIDDAFNSNPAGAAMALDVLAAMKPGGRVLVTPGMIELGDRQYELNADFGEKAAVSADTVIVVGQYNRDAIVEGLKRGGMADERIVIADSFADAQVQLNSHAFPVKIILYENDLPDTFK